MSTSALQVDPASSWKQEVNQRLAAHQSRRGASIAGAKSHLESHPGVGGRAAEAAARVAARYAKAPSYSEMLAAEARAAVRAAEAVSRAALEAQAAAESLLAGLEAVADAERPRELEALEGGASERAKEKARETKTEPAGPAAQHTSQTVEKQPYGILWDTDMPVRHVEPRTIRATRGSVAPEASSEDWWQSSRLAPDELEGDGIEMVEPAQPIHANLIEFPRELVATRKIRPRLAEGSHGRVGDAVGQLSIFEVDPGSISIEPAAETVVDAPEWPAPDWSSIQLGEHPLHERPIGEETQYELTEEAADWAPQAPALEAAPIGKRLMAAVVDGSLIAGAFVAAAMAAMDKLKLLPAMKMVELGSAATVAALALLYYAFFFTVAAATPGMKWARISLTTFNGEKPTRKQRCNRLWAFGLSLLPVGLGVVWAIFDEERLSWHDRLSGTYVRRD